MTSKRSRLNRPARKAPTASRDATAIWPFGLAASAIAASLFIHTPVALAQDAPSWNNTTKRLWAKNVPDFFQHQKLGKTADGGQNDSQWERPVKIVAGSPSFDTTKRGGWCRLSAFQNAFYYWRKAGYSGVFPGAGAVTNPGWLDAVNAYTKLFATFSFRPDKTPAERGIKAALKLAGHDESKGVSKPGDNPKKGLVYVEYKWDAAAGRITYPSSDGAARFCDAVGLPLTMMMHAGLRLYAGSSVVPHLEKNGAPDPALWWTNYHNVTLAGVDFDDSQLFFADPDCNRGHLKTAAGWTMPQTRKYKAWDGTDDVIPVPTPSAATPPDNPGEFRLKYVEVTMAADGRTFKNDELDNERYRKVLMSKLEVIEPVRAAPAAAAPDAASGEEGLVHLFEVTPGSLFAMDEFWILPTRPIDATFPAEFITVDDPREPRTWEVTAFGALGGLVDPLGNPRSFGGIRVRLLDGPPLESDEVGELLFATSESFEPYVDGYDVLTRHPAITQNDLELPSELGSALQAYYAVQAIGEGVEPFGPVEQTTAWDICPADFNLDGMIDGNDLAVLIGAWNVSEPTFGDLDGDTYVDGTDLSILLAAWGPCPAR